MHHHHPATLKSAAVVVVAGESSHDSDLNKAVCGCGHHADHDRDDIDSGGEQAPAHHHCDQHDCLAINDSNQEKVFVAQSSDWSLPFVWPGSRNERLEATTISRFVQRSPIDGTLFGTRLRPQIQVWRL
ncbi:MAG: hypothetical protein R3C05_03540 [Pirellulaceae bacterium]